MCISTLLMSLLCTLSCFFFLALSPKPFILIICKLKTRTKKSSRVGGYIWIWKSLLPYLCFLWRRKQRRVLKEIKHKTFVKILRRGCLPPPRKEMCFLFFAPGAFRANKPPLCTLITASWVWGCSRSTNCQPGAPQLNMDQSQEHTHVYKSSSYLFKRCLFYLYLAWARWYYCRLQTVQRFIEKVKYSFLWLYLHYKLLSCGYTMLSNSQWEVRVCKLVCFA